MLKKSMKVRVTLAVIIALIFIFFVCKNDENNLLKKNNISFRYSQFVAHNNSEEEIDSIKVITIHFFEQKPSGGQDYPDYNFYSQDELASKLVILESIAIPVQLLLNNYYVDENIGVLLRKIPKVQSLFFGECNISSQILKDFHFPKQSRLSLFDCTIDGKWEFFFENTNNIEVVDFMKMNLTNEEWSSFFSNASKVKKLQLTMCGFDNNSLEQIKNMSNLNHLDIKRSSLSVYNVKAISSLPKLERLELVDCNLIERNVIFELLKNEMDIETIRIIESGVVVQEF